MAEHSASTAPELLRSGVLCHTRPGAQAIFLDRDGVLNRKVENGYVLSFDGFEFNETLLAALARHAQAGTPLVVVSNQRCVSRELITREALHRLMSDFAHALSARGVRITAWYCCPHGSGDACNCRKPLPGMLEAAAEELALDLRGSCMIGDSESDIEAGAAAGVGTCIRYDMDRQGDTARVAALLGALYGN